jgi:hypothetical protein
LYDDFGINYARNIALEAVGKDLHVQSFSFANNADLESALEQIEESELHYIVGIVYDVEELAQRALKHDIIGAGEYTWMMVEGIEAVINPIYSLDRETNKDLARALHGMSILTLHVQDNKALNEGLERFSQSLEMQEHYISMHAETEYLREFVFSSPESISYYELMAYDAVIALGIAACECERALFTGTELYEQLLKTEFDGVSGHVAFEHETGTRRSEDFRYRVQNLLISEERSTEEEFRFTSKTTSFVDLRTSSVEHLLPFVYADSSTTPPLSLPPIDEDMHLITQGALAVGLSLAGLAILLSTVWGLWTQCCRDNENVRAAQPIFLLQICVGTFLAAFSVVPLALQEPVPESVLDFSCMLMPWLLSVGTY